MTYDVIIAGAPEEEPVVADTASREEPFSVVEHPSGIAPEPDVIKLSADGEKEPPPEEPQELMTESKVWSPTDVDSMRLRGQRYQAMLPRLQVFGNRPPRPLSSPDVAFLDSSWQ